MIKEEMDLTLDSIPLSGFRQAIDLRVTKLGSSQAVMELTIGPRHLNSNGTLHGGVLAAMIDNTGGLAGCYNQVSRTLRKAVTLSLTTSFLASVSSGIIRAIGHKRSGGRRIFVATVEITDENGALIAIGEATYRCIDASKA